MRRTVAALAIAAAAGTLLTTSPATACEPYECPPPALCPFGDKWFGLLCGITR